MISERARRMSAWDHLLQRKFAFRPGYWGSSKNGPPAFYYVFLGTKGGAVQLGCLYAKRHEPDGKVRWKATLLPAELLTEKDRTPRGNKAYHERHRTDLGVFETRPLAAEALKQASLDRGQLAVRRAELLPPLFALAHEAP